MASPSPSPTVRPAETIADRVRRMIRANPSVLPTIASVVIFVGMVIFGEVAYGRILQFNTLSNLLINNAHLIVLAVALTFVILTGGIDLSVGSIIAVSSVAGVMLSNAGWNAVAVIVAMIGIGVLFGIVSGVLIRYFNVQPFIATLAMMFLGRGLASLLSTKPERLGEDSPIRWIGTQLKIIDGPRVNDLVITPAVVVAVVVVAAAFFVLHGPRTGRT
ncbi:sugar ABC transporter permease, partial [Microbacterium sp. ISL-103]|nr:sugar ABC transporter permease [Microbacterium sp. ISL-103]